MLPFAAPDRRDDGHRCISGTLAWNGQATITLQVESGQLRLMVYESTSVVVPHEMPWGRSVSVNEVRLLESGSNRVRLEIDMQSGDTIAIDAQRVEATE